MSAYSISRANRQYLNLSSKQIPGVGAYYINWEKQSKRKTSPSASIGKTKKFFNSIQKTVNVGPGTYNPQLKQSKVAASIKGRPKERFYSQIPSPTAYHNQKNYPTKQYSFGQQKRITKTQASPGPGQYQLRESHIVLGGHFTKQSREKLNYNIGPGPGHYKYENSYSPKKSQQISFPKEPKFNENATQQKLKSKIPGPGSYNINQLKKRFKGGKFNNAQRTLIQNKSEAPGPGMYNSNLLLQKRNPQAVIGSEKRLANYKNDIPGPGTYNIPKSQAFKKKNAYVVFLQQQRLRNNINMTPGPGSYQTVILNQSRTCSISPSNKKQKLEIIPGPLDYNPSYKSIQTKSPIIIIGNQQRKTGQKSITPGPGNYKIETKSYSKTVHFTKAKRIQTQNSSKVGPGHYKIKPLLGMYDGKKNNKQILYV